MTSIIDQLNVYKTIFLNEQHIERYAAYLGRTRTEDLFDRKNFDGHITTSAFIVDLAAGEMLLLRHKALNRWLQPGGHVEPGDLSLLASALREAVEETGIPAYELQHIPTHADSDMPFDIDPHYIPANPGKAEDGHYHHDVRYVFGYTGDRTNSYDAEEATGLKWVSFDELADDDTFARVIGKIKAHILPRV